MGIAPRYTSGEHRIGVSPLLQPLEGPYFSTGHGVFWTSVPASCCLNVCLQYGLGCYMQQAGSLRALDGASTALDHKLPRALGSASSLVAVPATAVSQACVGLYGQHCGCLVHQPVGRSTITQSPLLESHTAQIAVRCPHSGEAQSCSWCALTTAHIPQRMVTPSTLTQAVVETITQARAPSTRQAYALKWSLFANWCSSRQEDP